MSDMLDVSTKNYLNLLPDDDSLFSSQSQLKAPGHSRLSRSASFFSPDCASHNLSAEHVGDDGSSAPLWPSNIWSQAPVPKAKAAFRPDRSMSLTESSSSLLHQLRAQEAFPLGAAPTVAPPPGFPPSSALPAQLPPVLSGNRYKTELCRGFQETGSCKYGNKCQFAHGEAELRGMFRHPKYKTEPCRTFYNFGYCPYGSRCHFIHEEKLGGALLPARLQSQLGPSEGPGPRHPLRQSVSFAGFLGSSRCSPPPFFPSSLGDANAGFSRAPSVSPPPADLLSPVFLDAAQFQFGGRQSRASAGDIHGVPLILEPKASRCVCGHGNNGGGGGRVFGGAEEDGRTFFGPLGGSAFTKPPGLQRSSSEDSLEDSYSSSSSGGSSGSESPTFDGSAIKRLTVFERLSLSD
ncbi:mRNA decay activator protein ZFP36 [Betta splendens]|uniref:mRNA decay activator protein ZFP36 n=1 Tax=Betta splendens TaxID=158456 RepID=A0A6P7P693_BETSP|nr:mRNA decay activator protein ZFP36 [Betta splendens]